MLSRRLKYSLLFLLLSCSLSAQKNERKDSLVRLLGCDKLQQIEEHGVNYRKALGHARFEHNATMLLCDTALWNVNANTIKAFGNVRIIQNRTVLSSDKLDYFIDDNLAEFRGTIVQLQDKDKNTLRTRNLDYNTKDSVAIFRGGGAFRDKDGQVIESDEGTYDAKVKDFGFRRNVNMYTDSIFVKTDALDYNTETAVAVFGSGTNAWRDDNMLSAKAGWYNHDTEVFTFTDNVHVMTARQEAWADTLVYYRTPSDVEMFGNVELMDTTRNVIAVAGYMQYIDSLQYIKMTRDPAIIGISTQEGKKDTVYLGADKFVYWTVPKCDVPDGEIAISEKRLEEMDLDPISEYRQKAAADAKAAAEEAKKKMQEEDPGAAAAVDRGRSGGGPGRGASDLRLPAPWDECAGPEIPLWAFGPQLPDTLARQVPDTLTRQVLDTLTRQVPDTLSLGGNLPSRDGNMPLDSQGDSLAVADSLANIPLDSTKIGFLQGIRNVKVFRKDMQVSCDSLAYNDLDSLIRLYRNPVVWNEIRRQYSADSITVLVKDQNLDRASLMSNAFIIVQEDSICFDQIKGTDMMAYFDTTGALRRFDSMGGSSGVFFIEEKGAFATVNKFESKMLTATFKDGDLYDLNYFEDVKSNAYPVVQLKKEEQVLKGFEWQPEKRPKGPEDITSYTPRDSERGKYEKVPRAGFPQTEIYFPGHMKGVYKMLALQDSLKAARNAERRRLEEERKAMEALLADSLSTALSDSLASGLADSLKTAALDSLATRSLGDSLRSQEVALGQEGNPADTLVLDASQIDSLLAGKTIQELMSRVPVDPKEEMKARQKAEKEAKKAAQRKLREEKAAEKEAKWAALDAKDAERAARKAAKAQEKHRAKTLKMLKAQARREAKEQKIFERYKAKYEKQKARTDAKAARKAEKKALKQSVEEGSDSMEDGSEPVQATMGALPSDSTGMDP